MNTSSPWPLPELKLPDALLNTVKVRPSRQKSASMFAINSNSRSNAIKLSGSLIAIPDRSSINTETTLQKDRSDIIRRGGR